MADEKRFLGIEKKNAELKQHFKDAGKAKEKLVCECLHVKKGSATLVKNHDTIYTCKQCEKNNINLSPNVLDAARIRDAIEAIDNVLDIAKLQMRPDSDDQVEVLKKIAKTQFFLRYNLPLIADSVRKKQNKSKDKRRDDDAAWGKSRVV